MGRKNADVCDIPTNDAENTEVLEEGSRSILMGIIKQFGKDMDLSRVTLPTFVLEPRSMLEKITDFMAHPELAEQAAALSDPTERFVAVVKYFLSGWHIKPKGVKKPYNPVLGEFFRCRYEFKDGSQAYYIAEQVSHHPPVSAYHYANPQHGIIVDGEARPKARFLGNSAATIMNGYSRLTFAKHHNETYEITNPNVYARGILFGKMLMELGDQCTVKCVTSDLVAELDFKTKGIFSSGQYHAVVGKIKKGSTGELLYDISGSWTSELFIKPIKNKVKEPLFTVKGAVIHPKIVEPESVQEENESRRLWSKLTAGLRTNDLDGATEAKTVVENQQRQERQEREKKGDHWTPRFFDLQENGDYQFTHRSK
ncbi:hypothetical protein BCR42DRAFT_149251 [Absidia repens]|uniref:Oxysterol-binding protein n=1 Tax=Absidia repens TaxID=90262 RepID=A0A1X2I2G5_9FUNG|nr:hypothetical protein BCR42DRAFT_149251 [Absidia repens]